MRVIDKINDIKIETRIVEIQKADITKSDINIVLENKSRNIAGSIARLQERTRINETYAQGHEQFLMIPFLDNADQQNPAFFEFFIPADMVNINEARLRIQLLPFRAYSRAVQGGGGIATTTTAGGGTTGTTTAGGGMFGSTEAGGASVPTTSSGGGTTQTTTAGGGSFGSTEAGGAVTSGASSSTTTASLAAAITTWQIGVGNGLLPDGMSLAGDPPHAHRINASPIVPSHSHDMQHTHNIPSHMHNLILQNHFHQITIPQHSHTVNIQPHSHSVNIPNHQHQITIPPHQHNLTLPNHTHDIEFGIWQGQTASNVSIRVDNNTIPLPQGTDLSNLDAIPFLRRGQGGNGTD